MAEYIDRERVANMLESAQIISDGEYNGYCTEDIDLNVIPSEDVVPRSVYDQVVWERDTALYQLRHDYGVSLGEKKPDDVAVVRCRDCAYFGYDKFGDAGCCAPVGLNVPDEDSFCSYGKRRERDTSDEAWEMVKTLRWIASNEDIVFNARSATEAADLIERLAEAGESGPAGWISVKDRLPDQELLEHMKRYQENFVEVLVMIKGGQIATALTWDGNSFSDNHIVEYEVTHWMPLPEPPGDSDAQD